MSAKDVSRISKGGCVHVRCCQKRRARGGGWGGRAGRRGVGRRRGGGGGTEAVGVGEGWHGTEEMGVSL